MHISGKKSTFTQKDILARGVEEIIEKNSIEKRLRSGVKLRVKFGIDPTGPDIHIGHTVPLWKLRQFQDLGHKVILIIGDFTATIGDPSGQNEERKVLTKERIKRNMRGYLKQVGRVLDIKKTEIHYNSEWHEKEGLDAVLQLTRTTTVQQLIERADFTERMEKGKGITAIELFYPLLQGYDSVKVKADIEIGGTDQKFNLLMGRQVQKRYGQKEQDVMMLPLLRGMDGVRKMSKSSGNYIALLDKPQDMFGKIMSIPDDEIVEYFELATPLSYEELVKIKKEKITGKRARDLKLQLADTITRFYWGEKKADDAAKNFESVFKKHESPVDTKEFSLKGKKDIIALLVETGLAPSKTEARRLIQQGGVYISDKKISSAGPIPNPPFILRVGRRKTARIVSK